MRYIFISDKIEVEVSIHAATPSVVEEIPKENGPRN
jgi:hypothetical protein